MGWLTKTDLSDKTETSVYYLDMSKALLLLVIFDTLKTGEISRFGDFDSSFYEFCEFFLFSTTLWNALGFPCLSIYRPAEFY